MSYYTYHNLEVETGKHTVREISEAIHEERNGIFFGFTTKIIPNDQNYKHLAFYGCDSVKWYDEMSDMTEFSKSYPDAIFTVTGEGEDQGDVWEHQYQNGVSRSRYIIQEWSPWSGPAFKHKDKAV